MHRLAIIRLVAPLVASVSLSACHNPDRCAESVACDAIIVAAGFPETFESRVDEVFDTADGLYRLVTVDYGLEPGFVCLMSAPDGTAAMVTYSGVYGALETPCPGVPPCRCDFPAHAMSVFQSPEYLAWIESYNLDDRGPLRNVCRELLAFQATNCGPLPCCPVAP